MPFRLSADWLLTGTGDVIPGGAVVIDSRGRVTALGPASSMAKSPEIVTEHFAGAVLLPGLVNAHTHLELTGLDGQAEESDFSEWIGTIIRLKAARDPAGFLAAAHEGLRQSYASGVTTVADTGDSGAPLQALAEAGGSGIAYLEVFGPDPRVADINLAAFKRRVNALRRFQSERVRIGISPHAPYSVSAPLYRGIARFAAEEALPLAVHIAESAAESELLETASGPFAKMWEGRGIPLPSRPGKSPLAWLEEHGVLGADTLCIHAVRANTADIGRLQRHRCGVAHCPRSNRRHGHGDAPLRAFRDAGLRVGVGTDSAASVSPPDLLAEARSAASQVALPVDEALRLAMLGAAEAIGMASEVGSLEPGKWGDCVAIRLPPGTASEQVCLAVLNSGRDAVLATFVGGREVYRQNQY